MKQLSAAADKSVRAKPSTGRLLRLSYFFNALFPKAGDKLVLQALADVKPCIAACGVSESGCNSGKCSAIKVIISDKNASAKNLTAKYKTLCPLTLLRLIVSLFSENIRQNLIYRVFADLRIMAAVKKYPLEKSLFPRGIFYSSNTSIRAFCCLGDNLRKHCNICLSVSLNISTLSFSRKNCERVRPKALQCFQLWRRLPCVQRIERSYRYSRFLRQFIVRPTALTL